MQVHAGAAGGADVGQRAILSAGEVQEVAEGVFDALLQDIGLVSGRSQQGLKRVLQPLNLNF